MSKRKPCKTIDQILIEEGILPGEIKVILPEKHKSRKTEIDEGAA